MGYTVLDPSTRIWLVVTVAVFAAFVAEGLLGDPAWGVVGLPPQAVSPIIAARDTKDNAKNSVVTFITIIVS
jgi:hypothetical protein